jgi:hypothetical protein
METERITGALTCSSIAVLLGPVALLGALLYFLGCVLERHGLRIDGKLGTPPGTGPPAAPHRAAKRREKRKRRKGHRRCQATNKSN